MIAEPKTEPEIYSYKLLSQEQKVSLGLDADAFKTRMNYRLSEIRRLKFGNDEHILTSNNSENTRH